LALYSCFLNAAGRVLYDVFIYPSQQGGADSGFLIDVDSGQAEKLARYLKRFKLRADVKIRVVDEEEMGVWAVWNEGGEGEGEGMDEGYEDFRAPDMGRRVVSSGNSKTQFSGQETTVGSYTIRRMMKGVAEGQDEILPESALPQESNIDYMGGIDFRKGCYVGQELTIRTHHTGVVRKRILPVQIYDGRGIKPPESMMYDPNSELIQPPPGTNIARVGTKGRSAGKWVHGVGNIGLALCRLETMTGLSVTGEMGSWSPEQEFKVSWSPDEGGEEGEVKVKAFVPSWHLNRASLRDIHGEKQTIQP